MMVGRSLCSKTAFVYIASLRTARLHRKPCFKGKETEYTTGSCPDDAEVVLKVLVESLHCFYSSFCGQAMVSALCVPSCVYNPSACHWLVCEGRFI